MDWFGFGRRSSNLPQPTPLQQQRSKQIETLKQSNQGIREIVRDQEYRLTISCPNGANLSLHLSLPSNFPQDKPVVTISPASRHPWVDPSTLSVVAAPALNNFSVHSDLSRAIREIVDEFRKRPPTPLPPAVVSGAAAATVSTTAGPAYPASSTPTSAALPGPYLNGFASSSSASPASPPSSVTMASALGSTMLVSSSSSSHSPSHLAGTHQFPQPPAPPPPPPPPPPLGFRVVENHFGLNHSPSPPPGLLPPVPSVIPSLRDKTLAELKELGNDEGSLYAAIMELPDIKCLETNRIKIVQQTEVSAKNNLEFRPRVEERTEALKLKYQELESLKSRVDQKLARQTEKTECRSVPHLQDKLKIAVMEADEESETIAESFLDGETPLDQFLKNYKSKRKLSHARKMAEEKLGHLIYTGQVGDI